jgi:putative membrane protein
MAGVRAPQWAKSNPRWITGILSLVGYALVGGAFTRVLPGVPELSRSTVLLFGDLIAVVNSVTLVTILLGFWFIRRGQIRRHRAAMLTAFSLIIVFLVLYLWKVGGGFEKSIVIAQGAPLANYAGIVRPTYLLMLAIHITLSVVAVPIVLHAVVLGLTHRPSELADTVHPKVGRIAVAAWSLSLFLGIVTYLLLNHVYTWEVRGAGFLLVATVTSAGESGAAR